MDKRFVFRANAVGVAGHITKPEDSNCMHGACSLPVVGGYAQSKVNHTQLQNVLEFESAWTQTSGDFSENEKAYKTLATATVKGLNVTNRLTADLLEATLTSTQSVDGGHPAIIPTTIRLENLRLDGYPVRMSVDSALFTEHPTKESLAKAFGSDDDFHKKHQRRFHSSGPPQDPGSGNNRKLPEVSGLVSCSIVDDVSTEHPKAVVKGHSIRLDGFGTIFLGEFLITDVSRRLTLLRLKLGSPVAGDIACAEVESNGSLII